MKNLTIYYIIGDDVFFLTFFKIFYENEGQLGSLIDGRVVSNPPPPLSFILVFDGVWKELGPLLRRLNF